MRKNGCTKSRHGKEPGGGEQEVGGKGRGTTVPSGREKHLGASVKGLQGGYVKEEGAEGWAGSVGSTGGARPVRIRAIIQKGGDRGVTNDSV